MKIIVNYDLMRKINISNQGIRLDKMASKAITATLVPFSIYAFSKYPSYAALSGMVGYLGTSAIQLLVLKYLTKTSEEFFKEDAIEDLKRLLVDLMSIEIDTTLELLQESSLLEKDYYICLNDSRIPVIKQDKYIIVPLPNGYEETIHQEHTIGSLEYEISVGSPQKKLILKPIKEI